MEEWEDLPSMSQNISLHLRGVMASPCCLEVQAENQGATEKRELCDRGGIWGMHAFKDDWDLRGKERRKGFPG